MKPRILNNFKNNIFEKQPVYKNKHYKAVYINKELFEKIYKKDFSFNDASKIIENDFSISLNGDILNGEVAYVDRQKDPFNIALSGNSGSGRAFFYKDIYNIKGCKTCLATSQNNMYNNGKFALSAALKEAAIANVVNKNFNIKSFGVLAVLVSNEYFDFVDQFLNNENIIEENIFNLPCAIEIRVYENNEFDRISNHYQNSTIFNNEQLIKMCDKFAKLEAQKIIKRFLHGSWSTGNITNSANMIDFDTSAFLDSFAPQYSNTNKYKSNYFGFEYIGAKNILEQIAKDNNLDCNEILQSFDKLFKNYYKFYFAELICLDSNNKYFEKLFNLFDEMSKYYTNYNGTFIYDEENNHLSVYNFPAFFQNYLALKKHDNDFILGLKLLLSDSHFSKEGSELAIKKNQEFFDYAFIKEEDYSYIFEKAKEFIKIYDLAFNNINNEILNKQFVNNENKYYLSGTNSLFSDITNLYINKEIDEFTIHKILNYIIMANSCNNILRLKIFKNFIIFVYQNNTYINFMLIPINNFDINFAKLKINNEEYMFHHKTDILISDDIDYNTLQQIFNANISIEINKYIKISY